MEVSLIFQQMLVLLLLLITGVIAARTGVIDEETNRRFTRITLLIPQTCMILGSVINADMDMTPGRVFAVLGVCCVMYAVLIALSFLVPAAYRCGPEDRGVYSFMTIFGNTGFMGMPVVGAAFGDEAMVYAALALIPFNLLAYTYGIALLRSRGERGKIEWRLLLNPPLIASAIAVLLLCVPVSVPAPLASAVGMLGDMVVPCSMMIIGASLGSQKLGEVFGDWRAYAFSVVPLIVAPLAVWAVLRLFVKDALLLGTLTILAAMPVASLSTMLSIQYGGNVRMASRTVFVTTILSVATIPFVCWLLPL